MFGRYCDMFHWATRAINRRRGFASSAPSDARMACSPKPSDPRSVRVPATTVRPCHYRIHNKSPWSLHSGSPRREFQEHVRLPPSGPIISEENIRSAPRFQHLLIAENICRVQQYDSPCSCGCAECVRVCCSVSRHRDQMCITRLNVNSK